MFTPEFINSDIGAFILVANHSLESDEATRNSISYNKTRIAYGRKHLPAQVKSCRLIYDIRGQTISETNIDKVKQALESLCSLEFMR
jgi:hypothetical protein